MSMPKTTSGLLAMDLADIASIRVVTVTELLEYKCADYKVALEVLSTGTTLLFDPFKVYELPLYICTYYLHLLPVDGALKPFYSELLQAPLPFKLT